MVAVKPLSGMKALVTNENFEPNVYLQLVNVLKNYAKVYFHGKDGPSKILYTHQIIDLLEGVKVVGPQLRAHAPQHSLLKMIAHMLSEDEDYPNVMRKLLAYGKAHNRLMDKTYAMYPNYEEIYSIDLELVEWVNGALWDCMFTVLDSEPEFATPDIIYGTQRFHIFGEDRAIRCIKIEFVFNDNESMTNLNDLMKVRYMRKLPSQILGHANANANANVPTSPPSNARNTRQRVGTPHPAAIPARRKAPRSRRTN